jgi:DNA-binding response OmpR family regulator
MSVSTSATAPKPLSILLYSHDRNVRERVLTGLGRRPSPELPSVTYIECATPAAAISAMDAGGIDLAIFDGEAAPIGGMGLCRQVKDEIFECPPVLVLIGRPQDAWLATWSRADGVVPHPIDAVVLADCVAALLRRRVVATQ